jgi:hypothetical protein
VACPAQMLEPSPSKHARPAALAALCLQLTVHTGVCISSVRHIWQHHVNPACQLAMRVCSVTQASRAITSTLSRAEPWGSAPRNAGSKMGVHQPTPTPPAPLGAGDYAHLGPSPQAALSVAPINVMCTQRCTTATEPSPAPCVLAVGGVGGSWMRNRRCSPLEWRCASRLPT